jgi:arabinofuranosyltransferase
MTRDAAMKRSRGLTALVTLVFLLVLLRTAWVSDDALISLRTVLNVTHGYGLTFNIVERVQTFTHPLWLFAITAVYLVVRNIYVAVFTLSIGASLWVFWIAVRNARSPIQAWLVAGVLLFSHAFMDFATSGLENPLSNLLFAAVVALCFNDTLDPRRRLTGLWLCLSGLYLTRPDDVLLALPVVLLASVQMRRIGTIVRAAAIGLAPALAWTVFALIYYGFPFPNTAYAKLGAGISGGEMWTQGVLYLVDSIDRDPITLLVVAFGAALAVASRTTVMRALAAGLLLHLLYIVTIGGDFMSGRFLCAPLFVAVLIIGRAPVGGRDLWVGASVLFGLVGLSPFVIPATSDSRFSSNQVKRDGIADERAVYFQGASLLNAGRRTFDEPEYRPRDSAQHPTVVMDVCGLLGDTGVNSGPDAHALDSCALADPLLARLPAVWNTQWRIGHFRRMIPKGYREGLLQGANLIEDASLHTYYDQMRLITRGPFFSAARWRAIASMNTGAFTHLIDRRFYRFGGELVALADVSSIRQDESALDAPGTLPIAGALAVAVEDRRGRRYLDIAVNSDQQFHLEFIRQNRLVSAADIGPIPEYRRKPGFVHYTLDVPARAARQGFDTVLITPIGDGATHVLGHLILDGEPTTDPELLRRVAIRDGFGVR